MKKMIVVLLSAFALLSGGDACFAQVSAARHGGVHPGRDRRPEGYSKDSWTVYYRGLKVEGASASSFVDLGDGYGKDNWKVFYCGEEVKGASASSFESLGKGRGRDNWNTYLYGERQRANAKMTRTLGGGYSKGSWTVYYREREVEGAAAGSFVSLGGGYGKDAWTVFFQGRKVGGASASSFENIGKGYGKDAWSVYYRGEKSTVRLRPRSKSLRSDGDGRRSDRERAGSDFPLPQRSAAGENRYSRAGGPAFPALRAGIIRPRPFRSHPLRPDTRAASRWRPPL